MQTEPRMTNLQLEMLKIFSFEIGEKQLLEIKSILSRYFADKISSQIDELFEKNKWSVEKISEWENKHMRKK